MAKHTSQSCDELQPAVCLSRGYVAIWKPPEHSWTSDRPEKQATAKAARVTFGIDTCWIISQRVQLSFNGAGKVCLDIVCVEGGFS